ncbi:MAG: threonine-phosphate decarboxylase [Rhodospirillaceae bacterium]|nr:threonine-phosphate decarboxylase [Rhodospirillaceae bacterium]
MPHGGDLAAWAGRYGRPVAEWLDLSTGINPVAYPLPDLAAETWTKLPQSAALAALKEAAAKAYGASSPEMLACAPGTQALIQVLPLLFDRRRVSILGPTYSEHASAWRQAGAEVTEVGDLPPPDRSLVLVNPNNPDGRTIAPDVLAAWARDAAGQGQILIVDEAFADVRPEVSLVPTMPLGNVVILRSFGKFFGLAGLRLGFAVAAPDIVRRLETLMGPWAVSGPGLVIGARALSDGTWIAAERDRLAAAMVRLREMLTGAGAEIVGGTDLFVTVDHGAAPDLFDHLARAGILVRRFDAAPRRLRFGLPGDAGDWGRLEQALAAFTVPCAPEAVSAETRRHG